jgi:hypothetical protein
MSDTILVGIGDSFMQGAEAGGKENSFFNILAKTNGWDFLNLSRSGLGNLGTVNHLLLSSSFQDSVDKYSNKILIWMPTGLNRIDVPNPDWNLDQTDLDPSHRTFFPGVLHPREICLALIPYVSEQAGAQDMHIARKTLDSIVKVHNMRFYIFPSISSAPCAKNIQQYFPDYPEDNYITVDEKECFYHWAVQLTGTTEIADNYFAPKRSLTLADQWKKYICQGGHPTELAQKMFAERLQGIIV